MCGIFRAGITYIDSPQISLASLSLVTIRWLQTGAQLTELDWVTQLRGTIEYDPICFSDIHAAR